MVLTCLVQRQGEGETQMPLKISGKVSGILDDLSDAMSLLNELLPSSASDLQLQVCFLDPRLHCGLK